MVRHFFENFQKSFLSLSRSSERLLIDFGDGMGLFLEAGFYTGFAFSGKRKTEVGGKWESEKVEFGKGKTERLDGGIGFGAELKIMEKIQIGLRKDWGCYSLENSDNYVKFYNTNLAFTATYQFISK